MILSNRQITERLGDSVIIWPFNPKSVNTSSYDVKLGLFYYIERRPSLRHRIFGSVYNIWDFAEVQRVWEGPYQAMSVSWWHDRNPLRIRRHYKGIANDDDVIFLPPKHTILAHTDEFIGGRAPVAAEMYPDNPSTSMMKARSSYGRNFIEVCKCAGYGDVGYTNRWTMEITNNSRFYHIPLVVNRRIAQIVFMETSVLTDAADYADTGKYQTKETDFNELVRLWKPEMMLPRLDKDRDIPIYARALCPHNQEWDECPDCRH